MKWFSVEELCKTSTGISNIPNKQARENLECLVDNLLDPVRELYGEPIRVTSGYRSPEVNRKVGGVNNSQHTKGEAVDIKCSNLKKVWELLERFDYDQKIWEFGDDNQPSWIHISLKKQNNRRESLRSYKKDGKTVYKKGG